MIFLCGLPGVGYWAGQIPEQVGPRVTPDGQDDFLTLSPPSPGTFSFGQVQCV